MHDEAMLTLQQEDAAAQRLAPSILAAALISLKERATGARKRQVKGAKMTYEGAVYQRRKAAGVCVECGKHPPELRRVRCGGCLARQRDAKS